MLYSAEDPVSKRFRDNIRDYNGVFVFTSMRYNKDNCLNQRQGITCFSINGALYHLQGPLYPAPGKLPKFAQLYFIDSRYDAANIRQQHYSNLDLEVLQRLTEELHAFNPYISLYLTAKERLEVQSASQPARVILNPQPRLVLKVGADRRRYNLPTSDEIGIVIPDECEKPCYRDIVLSQRGNRVRKCFFVHVCIFFNTY